MMDDVSDVIGRLADGLFNDASSILLDTERHEDSEFYSTLSEPAVEHSGTPAVRPTVPPDDSVSPSTQTESHDLEKLIQPLNWRLCCTSCRAISQVAGPLDLCDFCCPCCRAEHYPFLEIEGRHVDLWRLRTLLLNIYFSRSAAEAVLLALSNTGTRAKALELDLPPRLILAHALAALLLHVDLECEQPLSYYLMGCIFPLLPWAFRIANQHESHDALRRIATEGTLASDRFDPALLPFKDRLIGLQLLPDIDRLEGIFHIEAINGPLQSTDHDRYSDSLGESVQEWSLAIDRLRKDVLVENEIRDAQHWGPPHVEHFCRLVTHELTGGRENRAERVLDMRLDSIWRKGLPVTRRRPPPLEPATLPRIGKLIEVVDHRIGCIFRALVHIKASGPVIGVNCRVFQQPPSTRGLYYNEGIRSAEAELFHSELYKEGASKWDTELGRTATDIGVMTTALGSVAIPIGSVWLLGWIGYICILTLLGLGLLRVYRRRWYPLPGPLRGYSRPGFLRSYFGLNFEVRALRSATVAETARKWGEADVASRPSLTAEFMRAAELGHAETDDLQFGAWILNERVAKGVVAAARALGIDMDEYEKEILNLVNHGVIANTVMGNASVRTNSRSASKGPRNRKASRDDGTPRKVRNP